MCIRDSTHTNGTAYNEYDFDCYGTYRGVSKRDIYGFNCNGIHTNGTTFDDGDFDRDGTHLNGTKINSRGFNRDGVHTNGTMFDERGFCRYRDYQGLYIHDCRGFDFYGYHKNGTRFNDYWYDYQGNYNAEAANAEAVRLKAIEDAAVAAEEAAERSYVQLALMTKAQAPTPKKTTQLDDDPYACVATKGKTKKR
jgi:hypothetical protein